MEGKKTFKSPKGDIFNTIYDIIELQNGDLILSDARLGRLHYQVTMYDYVWEMLYTITETGSNRSDVSLRIIGDRQDKAKEIRREFALLESMLNGGVNVEMVERYVEFTNYHRKARRDACALPQRRSVIRASSPVNETTVPKDKKNGGSS